MIDKKFLNFAALLLCLLCSACGGGGSGGGGGAGGAGAGDTLPSPNTGVSLQSISVTPDVGTIHVGATQQFSATATYSDGSSSPVSSATWTTSDSNKATVSARGLATGRAFGSVKVTATLNGVSGSASLSVTAASLQSINVTPGATPTPASIAAGGTQQFVATGTYSDNSTGVVSGANWSSLYTGVATIDSTGLAKGLRPGSSTITATLGSITGTSSLTVTSATLQSIALAPLAASMAIGSTQQFSATGTYSDTSTAPLVPVWSSDNTAVATIHSTSGLATAKAAGTANITATINGARASTTLTVMPATVASIVLKSTPSTSIPVGVIANLVATVTMSDGSSSDIPSTSVSWSSSDPAIATVNAQGQVSAIAVGESSIAAVYGGVRGTFPIAVNSATPKYLLASGNGLNAASLSSSLWPQGGTYPFSLLVSYTDSSYFNIPSSSATWTTGNGAVLSVDNAGVVKTVGVGTTSLTVAYAGISETYPNLRVAAPTPVLMTVSCDSAAPMTIKAAVWNAAYALDPSNATKWLAVDNTTCGSFANGVALIDVTSNFKIMDAYIPTVATTFNPATTYSTARSPQLAAGQKIVLGKISNGGFVVTYKSVYTITVQ